MAVLDITDSDLKENLQNSGKAIIKYYADWCGSCKLFNPKFKRLSNDERFGDVTFLNVNAETNPEARGLAGVTNLPFFAVFENGELKETVASTKEDAIVDLLTKLN